MFLAGTQWKSEGGLIGITLGLTLILMTIGWGIAGRADGILINEKNVMSLSRFQMAIWTILVLGAYFTYAFARLRKGDPAPLDIQMDWHPVGPSWESARPP